MADETPGDKPPAGWYDDPSMVNTRRYWDGQTWTEHRQEKPVDGPVSDVAPGESPSPGGQLPPGGSLVPRARSSSRPAAVGIIVGVVVLAAAVFGVRAIVHATSKFTVSGQLDLSGAGTDTSGDECAGSGGYDDISGGAEVVVRDSKGTRIAVGELEPGKSDGVGDCTFDFKITGIADKGNLYSVEVTHRGEITFKKSEADSVGLTLG